MRQREWDVLMVGDAVGADLDAMAHGCHFDYDRQVWCDGHDHGHYYRSEHGESDLFFCGADWQTCRMVDLDTVTTPDGLLCDCGAAGMVIAWGDLR